MNRPTRSGIPQIVLVVALLCVCFWGMAGIAGIDQIPKMATGLYGEPSPKISGINRLWITAQLIYYENALLKPRDPKGTPRNFNISQGEGVQSIANRLFVEGLISAADPFRIFLVYSGLDTTIQTGTFRLSPAMSAIEIARALQDSTPSEARIRILPGWRMEEIAAALAFTGVSISSDQFLQSAGAFEQVTLPDGSRPTQNLEGYFFPDTYQVSRSISAPELISVLTRRFKQNITPELASGIAQQKLTIAQAVILASIVQKEASLSEEMPLIASVFYNRLAQGMRLESDPTAQYALGYNQEQRTWWTNPLSRQDLRVNSPYNTYVRTGLPPGPICNPGIDALKAVAAPTPSRFFYFRARCDGSKRHNFAITYEEHLKNGCP